MKKNRQSGQALVELALILPLLVAILIGIIDCARAFHCWSTVNHMCVEAARVASQRKNFRVIPNYFGPDTHNPASAAVQAFNYYRSPLTPTNLTTGPTFTGVGQATDTVTVTCTFKFKPWFPGLSSMIGSGEDGAIVLTGFARQRKE